MDVEAVRAALSAPALAPPIARMLELPVAAVEAALGLLAEGAQPAFLAIHRPDRVQGLSIPELERIQAAAARAAAFEFQRQSLRQELRDRQLDHPLLDEVVRAAEHALDLDDVRVLLRKRKRGPAAKARGLGLGPLADALLRVGTGGALSDPGILGLRRSRRGHAGERASDEAAATHEHEHDVEHVDAAATPSTNEDDANADANADVEAAAPASAESAESAEPEHDHEEESASPDEATLADPLALAASRVSEALPTVEDVLAGARTICAERIAEWPALRMRLRQLALEEGRLVARIPDDRKEKAARFTRLAEHPEDAATIPSPTILALHRGEREGVLHVELELDEERVIAEGAKLLGIAEGAVGEQIALALAEAWTHSLGRAVRIGARRRLKERADRDAVAAYSEALRPLLLAPALGPVPVLGIDPGFAPGCRLAVVDANGAVVEHDTVFPLQPKQAVPQAKARITELVQQHGVAAIAIADAGGGRELERVVRETVRELGRDEPLPIVLVDSDMTALLAAARSTRDELGEEAPLRRAVACARRLRDPLHELVKVDPRKLGLGQFQHEVDQEELRGALEQTVGSCVSEVGVDVNRASADVLAKVAGLSHAISRALVGFRESHGPLRSRSQLFEVPGVAGKTFEQGAGFLRIEGGEQPLDATAIHPERYPLVTQMARDLGVTVGDLLGHPEQLERIEGDKYLGNPSVAGEPLGPRALAALLAELREPGRSVRPPFASVSYDPNLTTFADLTVGMELEGVITRIASFGAFVDVGLAQEALVHVSELSHGFTSRPGDVVHIGQVVRGRVIEIDAERKRFSLSIRALLPKPERPAEDRKPRGPRRDDEGGQRREQRRDRDGDRPREGRRDEGRRDEGGKKRPPKGGRRDRDDRAEKPERTLNFRLDLSALLDRVGKD